MYTVSNHYTDGVSSRHTGLGLKAAYMYLKQCLLDPAWKAGEYDTARVTHSTVEYPGGKCIVRPRIKS